MPYDIFYPPKSDRILKRVRTEVSFPHLPTITLPRPDNDARFLIVKSVHKYNHVASQSEFRNYRIPESILGKTYDAKKLRTGEMFSEVKSQQKATSFLKQTRRAGLDIRVTPHWNLKSSHGGISEQDLMNEADANLLEGLNGQGVTAVRRIIIRRDNKKIATKHIIPTFHLSDLPVSVNAGFIYCSVRPYIPKAQRCLKCQQFGHATKSFEGRITRARCSAHDHPAEYCHTTEFPCTNCQGPHPAYSRTGEKFKL